MSHLNIFLKDCQHSQSRSRAANTAYWLWVLSTIAIFSGKLWSISEFGVPSALSFSNNVEAEFINLGYMYIHDSNFKRTKNERKHCTQSVLSSPLPTDTQFSVPQTTNVINFLCILLVRVCAYANIFLPSFLPTLPPLPLSFFKDHPSQPSDVGLAPINHQLLIVWHILLVKLCWSYASGIN